MELLSVANGNQRVSVVIATDGAIAGEYEVIELTDENKIVAVSERLADGFIDLGNSIGEQWAWTMFGTWAIGVAE